MKLELKTENQNFSKLISYFLRTLLKVSLVVVFSDIALKIGIISRHYQIEYNCQLLSVEKSQPNFKKLSRLSNLKSKQRILEFCRGFVK